MSMNDNADELVRTKVLLERAMITLAVNFNQPRHVVIGWLRDEATRWTPPATYGHEPTATEDWFARYNAAFAQLETKTSTNKNYVHGIKHRHKHTRRTTVLSTLAAQRAGESEELVAKRDDGTSAGNSEARVPLVGMAGEKPPVSSLLRAKIERGSPLVTKQGGGRLIYLRIKDRYYPLIVSLREGQSLPKVVKRYMVAGNY